jgi:hypothetical protein
MVALDHETVASGCGRLRGRNYGEVVARDACVAVSAGRVAIRATRVAIPDGRVPASDGCVALLGDRVATSDGYGTVITIAS